ESGVNALAVLEGWYAPGDGGGGVFAWAFFDGSGGVDDGGTVLHSSGFGNVASYGWRRIYSGPLDVRWFGATGDGLTPGDAAIQRAIDAAAAPLGGSVEIPPGVYMITATLKHRSNVMIAGHGRRSVLKRDPTSSVLTVIANESWWANNGNYDKSTWVVDHD